MGVPAGDFQAAMEAGHVSSGASVRVPRGSRSWRDFEDLLAMTLNLAVIESASTGGSNASAMFGRTTV